SRILPTDDQRDALRAPTSAARAAASISDLGNSTQDALSSRHGVLRPRAVAPCLRGGPAPPRPDPPPRLRLPGVARLPAGRRADGGGGHAGRRRGGVGGTPGFPPPAPALPPAPRPARRAHRRRGGDRAAAASLLRAAPPDPDAGERLLLHRGLPAAA